MRFPSIFPASLGSDFSKRRISLPLSMHFPASLCIILIKMRPNRGKTGIYAYDPCKVPESSKNLSESPSRMQETLQNPYKQPNEGILSFFMFPSFQDQFPLECSLQRQNRAQQIKYHSHTSIVAVMTSNIAKSVQSKKADQMDRPISIFKGELAPETGSGEPVAPQPPKKVPA